MVGIYKIENPIGEVYIGQSLNIEKRWSYYRQRNCKNQSKIYKSLLDYGVENHKFFVELEVKAYSGWPSSIRIMDKYEQFFIEKYVKEGYSMLNLTSGGRDCKLFEETKELMRQRFTEELKNEYSEARKGEKNYFFGKHHDEETRKIMSEKGKTNKLGAKNGRARAILQYDLNGNLIKEWETVSFASIELGISRLTISGALMRKSGYGKGFIWRYKND